MRNLPLSACYSLLPLQRFTWWLIFILILAACGGAVPSPTSTRTTVPTTPPSSISTQPPTATPSPQPMPEPTATPARIAEDEPVQILGTAEITFVLFDDYIGEPFVMLEDEAGFVQRDFEFVIPPENQVIGPLTRIADDTWEYVLHLPAIPPGTLVDVDNDHQEDPGVKVFAVAVQANLVDDPFLNNTEFQGWSTVWTSARIDSENQDEINGGALVVWTPNDQQAFPTDFGADQLLFTEDDPVSSIPAGYTIVNLDESPFLFYKETHPNLTLYEGDVAVNDYTEMSYTEAFDGLWMKASAEYPFTEVKGVNWQELYDAFAPRVAWAEAKDDYQAWYLALRDFAWSIPDGHVGLSGDDGGLFRQETAGGLGMGLTELDDGRVIVHFLTDDGSAATAGIELGAEILEVNGLPPKQAAATVVPWSSPFSTEHVRRLQQYRYLARGTLGQITEITWKNSGADLPRTTTLTFSPERASFAATSLYAGFDRNAPPVEYEILHDSGYGYVRIWDLADDLNLIIRLFDRAVKIFHENDVPGVILDLRQNLGGSPMGTRLARYFTEERLELSRGYYYSQKSGEFETHGPADTIEPDPDLQYAGPIVVLVGPACASACEHIAWVFSQLPQVRVVGQYPTYGAMGEVGRGQYELPDGLSFQVPTGMELTLDGNILVEGSGVVPDVTVPVSEETVFAQGDVVLEAAIQLLGQPLAAGVTPSGPPRIASQSEAKEILQARTLRLEDLARESYDKLPQAGETYTYTVVMAHSRDILWLYGWCTATEEQLVQNWDNIDLTFTLNGEAVPLGKFVKLEGEFDGQQCRYYFTALGDWPHGEHPATTKVTFTADLDNGFRVYPAGTHMFEYRVYVNELRKSNDPSRKLGSCSHLLELELAVRLGRRGAHPEKWAGGCKLSNEDFNSQRDCQPKQFPSV